MVLALARGDLNVIFMKTHSPNKQSQLLNILRDCFKISQDVLQGCGFQIRFTSVLCSLLKVS